MSLVTEEDVSSARITVTSRGMMCLAVLDMAEMLNTLAWKKGSKIRVEENIDENKREMG